MSNDIQRCNLALARLVAKQASKASKAMSNDPQSCDLALARLAAKTLSLCIDAFDDLDNVPLDEVRNVVDVALQSMNSRSTWAMKDELVESKFGSVRLADLVDTMCQGMLDFEHTAVLSKDQVGILETLQIRFRHGYLTKRIGNVNIKFY